MTELKTKYLVLGAFLAPFLIMGSVAGGGYLAHLWWGNPPPLPVDPRAIDEIRKWTLEDRRYAYRNTIDRIDISNCQGKTWELRGDYTPTLSVTGHNCKPRKKGK